jgi:hypothetical protein
MTKPADPNVVAYIRAQVERFGVRPVGRRLKFSDSTVAKLAAGLPVSEGISTLARLRVQRLEKDAA